MVTNKEVQELNQKMVSGIVNKTGYLPSDYPTVAALSRLIVPLSDLEAYILLKVLIKYPNNPIIQYKYDDIRQSYELLKEFLKRSQEKRNYTDEQMEEGLKGVASCKGHKYADFTPYKLNFVGYTDTSVTLGLREYVPDLPASQFDAHWERLENGKSVIVVPNSRIEAFLKYIRTAGVVGHISPVSLTNYLASLNTVSQPARENPPVLVSFYPTGIVNEYGHDAYVITSTDKELASDLWKQKDEAVKFVDTKTYPDKTVVYTTKSMLPKLIKYCQDRHMDIHTTRYPLDIVPQSDSAVTSNASPLPSPDSLIPKVVEDCLPNIPITPYPYQLEDANKLLTMRRALLGHDMGCGKTIITILVGMHIQEPKIVICPESLRLNWKKEVERMTPDADISVVYSKDLSAHIAKDWTIMGYQTAAKFKDQLCVGPSTLIIDEAHNIKAVDNYGKPKSARAKAIMEIAERADRLYLLTGTPMPTRSKDLYNILVMLHAIKDVPYAFHKFGLQYCRAFQNNFGWNYNGTSNREELHGILSMYMLRRLKKDVLPHLKKQRQFIPVDDPNKEYKAIEKDMMSTEPTLAYLGKAMKGRRLLSRNKIGPAIDLAENFVQAEESVVIVTEFKETLDKIAAHFGNNACTICGDMTDKAKEKAKEDFQSGRKKVCVLNIIAGGLGLTLTRAHNMIICDYDWTPSNMVQVEDRICRSGQTECCNIYYLYCENALLDQAFISMITHKSENVDKVVDNSENTTDLETAKSSNKMYYEYLVAQIRKEKAKGKKAAKKANKETTSSKPRKANAKQ